ncbi:P-loop containing nucleoside triphosphate hydrolase protein [Stachybotrys elegans]|uniref:P-loop containing nucleoside triphosphate hydrolase protein n=1 Tax=Stachybotrys elegans TaxID=80388 RepID=A0A8K0WQC3_9HYPO|nr:P-loop containing nucleoside triphosphate hydrolase protein [Stachybotrys elegans]
MASYENPVSTSTPVSITKKSSSAGTPGGYPPSDSGIESSPSSPTPLSRWMRKHTSSPTVQQAPAANPPALGALSPEALPENPFEDERSRSQLEAINKLQSWGPLQELQTPQLVIVGGQSTGKSSLLRTLTGIPFPIDARCCTRFPTRIVSRRTAPGTSESYKITLEPPTIEAVGLQYAKMDKAALYEEGSVLTHEIFSEAIKKISEDWVKIVPGKGEKARNFVSNVLNVEMAGPDKQPFSIIDLPGIFASSSTVKEKELEGVRNLAIGYMSQPQNIIVCVCAADYDIANQDIFDLAKKHVQDDRRLVGVLTRCDRCAISIESVQSAVDLATGRNKRTGADVMNGGWFVVRNRVENDGTPTNAASAEEALFNEFPWNLIPADHRGSSALRTRLASMLSDKIGAVFPQIRAKLDNDLAQLLNEQAALGGSRDSFKDKQQYVLKFVDSLSKHFDQALANEATTLRPKVRYLTDQFDSDMRESGHEWEFEEKMLSPSRYNKHQTLPCRWPADGTSPPLPDVSRPQSQEKLYKAIHEQLGLLQANQLPGVLNPRIYPIMYTRQTKRWRDMAMDHLKLVHRVVEAESINILDSLCGSAKCTSRLINRLKTIILDMLQTAFGQAGSNIESYYNEELSLGRALLTSDPSFADRVNKCRLLRFAEASKKYREWVLENEDEDDDEGEDGGLAKCFETMHPSTKMNIATDVHDVLMVYYEMTLEYFIRYINNSLVEGMLNNKNGPLKALNTEYVLGLSEEEIDELGGEEETTRQRRKQLIEEISIRRKAIRICAEAK